MVLNSFWLYPVIFTFLCLVLVAGQISTESHGDRLTQEEIKLVAKFRETVKDITYEDWMASDEYLIRWLRIRNNNLKAARDALQQALEWRKSDGIDRILKEDFKDIEDEFKVIFEGVDKSGRPLAIFGFGSVDIRKIVLGGRGKRLTRFFVQCLELTQHILRDLDAANGNSSVTRAFFILDIAGFNLRQHACAQCVPTLLSIFQVYESYYPDLAYKFWGLYTPRVFLPFAGLVRPFMSVPTQQALELFDNNSDRWKEALLNEIDADQLPVQYGGTKIIHGKVMSDLKKTNPLVKAVFDRATAAAGTGPKKQNKSSVL